jgi:putative FmdB family regulatory protein
VVFERPLAPVMMMMSVMPQATASSTTYWMAGLSTSGNISLGWALAAGRNLVPSPAAGMTAFLMWWATKGCSTTRDRVWLTAWVDWHSDLESASSGAGPEDPIRMPTYEYACKSCGEHLEVVQSFKDDALTECPACGGPLRKVFGNIGIAFKGSGFYKTDSRSASEAAKPAAGGATKPDSATKADSGGSSGDSGSSKPSEAAPAKKEPAGAKSGSSSSPPSSAAAS